MRFVLEANEKIMMINHGLYSYSQKQTDSDKRFCILGKWNIFFFYVKLNVMLFRTCCCISCVSTYILKSLQSGVFTFRNHRKRLYILAELLFNMQPPANYIRVLYFVLALCETLQTALLTSN